MVVASDIADKSEHLSKLMRSHGLDTNPYRQPPLAAELFAAAIAERKIRTWPGIADIQVHGDGKRRQVVLNVTEGSREITREFDIRHGARFELTDAVVMQSFPIRIPNGRLTAYEIVHDRTRVLTVNASVQAPKTSTSLLMGFDEVRQFIAMLPHRVTTVDQAHAALRPDDVSPRAIRQGEWFFDPATPEQAKMIKKALANRRMPAMAAMERGSSHSATLLTIDTDRFATGVVTDSRVKHHKPLVLDGWYRVVRNAEVVDKAPFGLNQTRTWD